MSSRRVKTLAVVSCWLAMLVVGVANSETVRVRIPNEPPSLNPLDKLSVEAHDIVERIYPKLLREQADFVTFEPGLAASYEFSADSMAITFRLRSDVFWHDGRPVTAEDVRFTYSVHIDESVAWPHRKAKQQIARVDVDDPQTVVFHFRHRYPYQLMDANDGVILPSHLLADVPRDQLVAHAIGREPLGAGEFRFEEWRPGQFVRLAREAPAIEPRYLEFRFVPDVATATALMRAGELDMLPRATPDQVRQFARSGQHRVIDIPSRDMVIVFWNLERPPFDDLRVRRALAHAVDTSRLMKTVWGGGAKHNGTPMHPILWSFDAAIKPPEFDREKSIALLAEAGWRDSNGDGVLDKGGKPFEFTIVTNHSSQQRVDAMTLVENDLRAIGIKVRLRALEFNTMLGSVMGGTYDACLFGWKATTKPDLNAQWHTASIPQRGYNITRFRDPDVDGWLDRLNAEPDLRVAAKLWADVQQRLRREHPCLVIGIPPETIVVSDRLDNVMPTPVSVFANVDEWRYRSGASPR